MRQTPSENQATCAGRIGPTLYFTLSATAVAYFLTRKLLTVANFSTSGAVTLGAFAGLFGPFLVIFGAWCVIGLNSGGAVSSEGSREEGHCFPRSLFKSREVQCGVAAGTTVSSIAGAIAPLITLTQSSWFTGAVLGIPAAALVMLIYNNCCQKNTSTTDSNYQPFEPSINPA